MPLNTTVKDIENPALFSSQVMRDEYDLRNLNTFYFLIYGVIGWLFEVVYCYAVSGELVYRGLLYGPYLPIYGFGAIIVINLIAPRCKTMLGLFLLSTLVCSLLEYFTSWYLETIFNVSLWNYSDHALNIHGRVSVLNSFLFGLLSLVVVYIFQPCFNRYLHKISIKWRPFLSVVIAIVIVGDFLFSGFTVQELASRGAEVLVLFS